jgi:hypothetical protein
MSLLVLIEIKTTAEHEAEFLRLARALTAATATEAGTLRYDWFAAQAPHHYRVVEEYADADAAEAHNHHVGSLLGEIFAISELVSATFFGELNAYIRAWVTGRDGISLNVPLGFQRS